MIYIYYIFSIHLTNSSPAATTQVTHHHQWLVTDHCHVQQVVDLQLLVDTSPVLLHQFLLLLGQVIVFLFDCTSLFHIISSQTLAHLEEPGTRRGKDSPDTVSLHYVFRQVNMSVVWVCSWYHDVLDLCQFMHIVTKTLLPSTAQSLRDSFPWSWRWEYSSCWYIYCT